MDIKTHLESLAFQLEELRALIEDIHQAVAPAPLYRGVIETPTTETQERQ
jgi:hypothetical protein